MPFFSHPVDPTAWLLPLVSGMLGLSSFLFSVIIAIAPYGVVALFVVVIALFSINLMKDPQPN